MSEPSSVAPASTARAWSSALIVLVLGYHVGMPLTYYLSDRVYDERFSWRMFSTVRLQDCKVVLSETLLRDGERVEQPTPVAQDVQTAWVGVLERMRPSVIEKYLARRCDSVPAEKVTFVGQCKDTDGSALPDQRFVMTCKDRSVQREGRP